MTPEAKAVLAERGYDPVFGARPLKRTIQRMIENPLAVEVLAGRFREGDTIVVEPDGGETLRFRKEARGRGRELSWHGPFTGPTSAFPVNGAHHPSPSRPASASQSQLPGPGNGALLPFSVSGLHPRRVCGTKASHDQHQGQHPALAPRARRRDRPRRRPGARARPPLAGERDVLTSLLASAWYPFELGKKLDEAIVAEIGGGRPEFFEKLGEASADKNLGAAGVHRSFLVPGDPHAFLAKTPLIYSYYYDQGRREYEKAGEREAVLTTRDAETFSAPDCLTVVGWYRRALEMCGRRSRASSRRSVEPGRRGLPLPPELVVADRVGLPAVYRRPASPARGAPSARRRSASPSTRHVSHSRSTAAPIAS